MASTKLLGGVIKPKTNIMSTDQAKERDFIASIKSNIEENNWLVKNLVKNYDEKQTETVTMKNVLTNETTDFSLYYCLSESLTACENAIKAKPSRELALVKTKLQEALFWLNEA